MRVEWLNSLFGLWKLKEPFALEEGKRRGQEQKNQRVRRYGKQKLNRKKLTQFWNTPACSFTAPPIQELTKMLSFLQVQGFFYFLLDGYSPISLHFFCRGCQTNLSIAQLWLYYSLAQKHVLPPTTSWVSRQPKFFLAPKVPSRPANDQDPSPHGLCSCLHAFVHVGPLDHSGGRGNPPTSLPGKVVGVFQLPVWFPCNYFLTSSNMLFPFLLSPWTLKHVSFVILSYPNSYFIYFVYFSPFSDDM